jgi:hypothetical protein
VRDVVPEQRQERKRNLNVAVLWAGKFTILKDRKSIILGVWAAPGAPETLAKGGGLRPPPVGKVSGAPGAAQTPKMTDFKPLNKLEFPPKVQPRRISVSNARPSTTC